MTDAPAPAEPSSRLLILTTSLLLVALAATGLLGQSPAEAETVERIAGANRYATSATISRQTFDAGVDTVWVASGQAFPDALSAGALAGSTGSPVLLTPSNSLPDVIKTELRRLRPRRILVAGGTSAIRPQVVQALASFASTVQRRAGDTRYGTSAVISRGGWANGASTVFIANGSSFPDALSAAPAAAALDAPILLSRADRLPSAILAELRRLDPDRAVLLGGTAALSNRVRDQLRSLGIGAVARRSGSNRYATAAAVSAAYFQGGSDVVYLASGTTFPDALSAAPLAARRDAPVLLTQPDQLTSATARELERLNPSSVILLGGTKAIGNSVRLALTGAIEGFPTPESTGPRVATSSLTVHQGSFETSRDGQVIQNMDIRGNLRVKHDNVTVRDTRIMFTSTYGINVRPVNGSCPRGATFEYVELDGRNAAEDDIPIYASGCEWTLDHAHVHNVGRSSRIVNNNTVSNSYIHSTRQGNSGAHRGGIGLNGGSHNRIINNVLMCEGSGCSAALAMYGDTQPINDILVQHNLFAATAAYCAYGGSVDSKDHPNASNVRFIDNHFSTRFFPKCGRSGPYTAFDKGVRGNVWQGNVWHESGKAVG